MNVTDAIKQLKELDPDDEIVITWWTNKDFPHVGLKDWCDNVDTAEDKVACCGIPEDIMHEYNQKEN